LTIQKREMSRRKKRKIFERVEIVSAGGKGKGIGYAPDGRIIFVPFTAPGDVVDVETVKKRKQYYEGRAIKFHAYSDWRTEVLCPHYGICGGCQWQHIRYEKQLEVKANEVRQNLKRIAGVEPGNEKPVLASPKVTHYRNKMEYAFTDSRWLTKEEIETGRTFDRRGLGFHIPGHWDRIIDVEFCALQEEPGNEIRNAIRDFAKANNLSFYNPRAKEGLLRQLTIRILKSGEKMVLVHFGKDDEEHISLVMNFIKERFPDLTSLQYLINTKQNDSIYDLDIHLWSGREYITEIIDGLAFNIKAKSFFQTNSYQTENLYRKIAEYAAATPSSVIYDLYSGTGTIALFLARHAKFVLGIESVEQAVEDARINAKRNQIENVEFVLGDMKEVFTKELTDTYGSPDIIVMDPPRDGVHKNTLQTIIDIAPEKIVYVSCNSATQARDLVTLKNYYEIVLTQAVDMFPQTYHTENIAVLKRKK